MMGWRLGLGSVGGLQSAIPGKLMKWQEVGLIY